MQINISPKNINIILFHFSVFFFCWICSQCARCCFVFRTKINLREFISARKINLMPQRWALQNVFLSGIWWMCDKLSRTWWHHRHPDSRLSADTCNVQRVGGKRFTTADTRRTRRSRCFTWNERRWNKFAGMLPSASFFIFCCSSHCFWHVWYFFLSFLSARFYFRFVSDGSLCSKGTV